MAMRTSIMVCFKGKCIVLCPWWHDESMCALIVKLLWESLDCCWEMFTPNLKTVYISNLSCVSFHLFLLSSLLFTALMVIRMPSIVYFPLCSFVSWSKVCLFIIQCIHSHDDFTLPFVSINTFATRLYFHIMVYHY